MFAQLDTKTVYSFLDSLVELRSYVESAKQLGYRSVGIMDANLYAAYHFIQLSKKEELQPILGLSIQIAVKKDVLNLYFIAQNTRGYHNLLRLSTLSFSNGLTIEQVSDYMEGITPILPYNGEVPDLPFDYYIGVYPSTPRMEFEKPVLPLYSVRYLDHKDFETLQVLHAIKENKLLAQVEKSNSNEVLKAPQEVAQLFKNNYPEALLNLENLVDDISYTFDTSFKLPRFNPSVPAVEELRKLTIAGLKAKNLWNEHYQIRLERELSVIHKMGFDDYFLIVWDLLKFGRNQGYYMGMGRGSAAGSLVAYALDITGIDPVKHNLIFERFLNEERYSMPDIDIDLPDIYRNEFLHYVNQKYRPMHSAQIVTFSTLAAKQAIRDVLKRYGIPEYELNVITRKIGPKDTLATVYQNNASFRQLIQSKMEYQTAYKIARRIEGFPRQTSIHAAGVVMSEDELVNHIPLKQGEDMMVTQYDASAVEANGLLKMDFLGLRNLTLVQRMQEKLWKDRGIKVIISEIDLEDKKTLELFASGNTKGIFQFEQPGAIRLLKRVKPKKFEDVVATTSLNRPGASDYIDNFINRRNGKEKIDLIDPSIASVLDYTYGIMLYQEQVMQIAQIYAGFSLGRADLLRRAMSKKNLSEMTKMEDEFLQGAVREGHQIDSAKLIFSRMVKFAGYGFNRSHAYAYSALAFQLAYFKTHYSDIFYEVMFNYANGSYLEDAISLGFTLTRLSINSAQSRDTVNGKKINLGLSHIKGIPRDLINWIVTNKPYASIEDFLMKLPLNYHKKELILPMVYAGLFDEFEPNRKKVVQNLDNLFIFVTELGSLFAENAYHWLNSEDYTKKEKYELEKEVLGIGISSHPLREIQKSSEYSFQPISSLYAGVLQTVCVQLDSIKVIRTKTKGEQMAFLTVSDTYHQLDVTIFPAEYQKVKSLLREGEFYYIKGKIQSRDDKLQMILTQLEIISLKKFWILLENHELDYDVSDILKKYPGDIPVIIHYQSSKETIASQKYKVSESIELEEELSKHVVKTVFR